MENSTKKNEVQDGPCRGTRGRGKKITWKPDSELVQIKEFENDPNERSNSAKFLNRLSNFLKKVGVSQESRMKH